MYRLLWMDEPKRLAKALHAQGAGASRASDKLGIWRGWIEAETGAIHRLRIENGDRADLLQDHRRQGKRTLDRRYAVGKFDCAL